VLKEWQEDAYLNPMLFKTLEPKNSVNTLDTEAVQGSEFAHAVQRRVLHEFIEDNILQFVSYWSRWFECRVQRKRLKEKLIV
jgi:hypothetical protein